MKERILYPKVDPVVWAKLYNIPVKEPIKCPKCKKPFMTTIPFATSTLRGLQAEEHACGKEYAAMVVVHVDKKMRDNVRRMFQEIARRLDKEG